MGCQRLPGDRKALQSFCRQLLSEVESLGVEFVGGFAFVMRQSQAHLWVKKKPFVLCFWSFVQFSGVLTRPLTGITPTIIGYVRPFLVALGLRLRHLGWLCHGSPPGCSPKEV